MTLLCFFSVLCLLCLCARLFICALWSPAGKVLTSWLAFVVSNFEFVTFSDTEAPFLGLGLSITNGIVSTKIYDKWDDFNFEIVNFPFLDGDVPRSPSYGTTYSFCKSMSKC